MRLPRLFKRTHTIANRLTWRVVVTMTLVFTVISAFIFGIIWIAGSFILSAFYRATMEISNERINNVFSNVEVAVTNNVTEVEENIFNEKLQYYAVEHLLQLNPVIVGAAVAYNPDYEPRKGEPFAPYAYRDSTGTLSVKQLATREYDYLHREWYTKPIETGTACWSEPYIDDGGGDIPMITFSSPVVNSRGELYAVQTADIALQAIADLREKMDSTINADNWMLEADSVGHAYSFIVTRQGTFIAHPDKQVVLKENLYDFFQKRPHGPAADSLVARRILSKENYGYAIFRDMDNSVKVVFYDDIERTGWVMAVVVPLGEIVQPVTYFIMPFIMTMLVGLAIVGLVCRYTIRRVTKPLRRFAQSADEIAKGNIEAELPKIKTKDEMLRLRYSFETMQQSLVRQIEETKTVNEQKGRIESELHIARSIQMAMLPKTFPPFPERNDIDIYGMLTPAREVGGDLFDFHIRDEKLFFYIGDVAGKGVPAAIVMAVTLSLARMVSAHESNPARIIGNLNDAMMVNNDSNMFVTLFVGVLDLPTGRLRYSNAGHNAPVLIGDMGVSTLPCDPNVPVGVMEGWRFTTQECVIAPQTTVFAYTDGLTEAENAEHRQFQEERMLDMVRMSLRQPRTLIEQMAEAVHHFVGKAEQSDDMTMLAIQYTKRQLAVRLQRSITLPNDIEQVPQLAAFVDGVCEAVELDTSLTMSINLALEEAVVNVMTYAYPAGKQGHVDIEAQANDERLKFVISDTGIPFDPTAREDADTTLSAEERPIGGLGIHLVRQIMDSINYERVDGKNVLTLRKKLV